MTEPVASGAKGLSLWQPWAWFVAGRLKRYETRSWGTAYRGPLVIVSTKAPKCNSIEADALLRKAHGTPGMVGYYPLCFRRALPGYPNDNYPLGAIVATCELADCFRVLDPAPRGLGDDPNDVVVDDDGNIVVIADSGDGTQRRRVHIAKSEFVLGNLFSDPPAWRWGWRLEKIRPVVTFPYRGAQGLFNVPDEVLARLEPMEATHAAS